METVTAFCRNALAPILVEAIREAIREPEAPQEKEFLSLKDAQTLTGLGRSTFYDLFKAGRLNRYKAGGKTLVKMSEVMAIITPESLVSIGVSPSKKRSR